MTRLSIAPAFDGAGARLARLRRAFDARARRERLLLIAAGVAVAWLLADALWLTPAYAAWNAARMREATAATSLARLQQDAARRGAESRIAEQQLRREVQQWRERVRLGDERLHAAGATLVRAADMVPMLERLTAQAGGLRLRSIRSLGATDALMLLGPVPTAGPAAAALTTGPSPATDASNPTGSLYRHGVELVVEGGYADVLAYLRAIEAMPQRVLGGGLQLKVERHPSVVMTLRLHTLSQDRGWLEI